MLKTFGSFEFDDRRRILRSAGQPVRLGGQALDLLCLFLERPGELVTREDIERALWPDRHVNVDHSLDVIVSRLRAVLDDRGPRFRYIETVPRRGYRFIEPIAAKVEEDEGKIEGNAAKLEGDEGRVTRDQGETKRARHWARRLAAYAAIALLAALLAILFARTRYDKLVPHERPPAASSSENRR